MKKIVTGIACLIVMMIISPAIAGNVVSPGTEANLVFNVYTTPSRPLGATWDDSIPGDIITLYADVPGAVGMYITWEFCNREYCTLPGDYLDLEMFNEGGTLWSYTFPGDSYNHWEYFEASSSTGQYIKYYLLADDGTGDVYYPGPDGSNLVAIYPAWPPSQINATSTLSRTDMFTGESFWVNGTSNYWNSTSYPNDFSKLLPADGCNVTVKVGPNTFPGKTDIWGNYSVEVTAPVTPGQHTVNVTVSNDTANRNVPCKSANQTITVNAHVLDLTLELDPTACLVNETVWANGTVEVDSASPGQVLEVNLSVLGTNISWTANTSVGGAYSSQFTAPGTVGNYTVNATVWHPYDVRAWSETDLSVLATPLADLSVTSANIVRTGTLLQGMNQRFNITVRNSGIANATDAVINISMDGTLLNSTVHTIPSKTNVTISINWTATPGIHNISVFADPLNLIEESNEANNKAWKLFTIAARTIGITVEMDRPTVKPGELVWANGTVTIDGVPAPADVVVNISMSGTEDFWLADTDSTGGYSAVMMSLEAEALYTVNATVKYPGYPSITALSEANFTVAIPPTPDLAVLNSDISIIGNLTNGTMLYFNIIVRNIGTDAANSVQVNVSIDGVLLTSSRQNIPAGGQRLINASWNAVNGTYNITVDVDQEDKFAEFSESNNHAWKTFTVAPTPPPDDDEVEEEAGADNTMLFAIIIIIIIVAAIAGLTLMKKSKAPTPPTEPEEAVPETVEPQPPGETPKP
ncbi:MAG: hypothetical protein KKH41_04075 [Candidatus Thermoplasmatota archaeon]|nr:hypothetical protein [Euryarchaeota archaeon]MBU4032580.1 hypothetical protein [Candidatus Thermoplasmatota archaeon]MBU4070955.1 hypothetical protein [Candidatus Thermoplasmatota archaeon]MBU4144159.1 hypothetical protein [Candidatus Thermoplasmatota archaeon]MBU4591745.1 hypothetical protein [Candidatus Thermoplasmatota archaeon]